MDPRPNLIFIVADDLDLFDLSADERERANRAALEPDRLQRLRADWEAWDASLPPIPEDATVSLGYSARDMPQR